tara:strand:- start:167 stop:835 length:669 start_codon:yes stop_codon:yes gene_type:complete
MKEQVLSGGHSNTVVRVGETVHRLPGPWTPAVHELLSTLHRAGVHEVPEPLGFDDQGREVLSFMTGDVGNYPLPDWLWEPQILQDAGELLRRVHDASVPLVGQDLTWSSPSREPIEVICHNDVAPYNMTLVDGHAASLFDFDTASPGPRIWDLAYLAYRLAPLAEDAKVEKTTDWRLAVLTRIVVDVGEASGVELELSSSSTDSHGGLSCPTVMPGWRLPAG